MITSNQIRMARALLKWTVDDLSNRTNIPWARIQFLEKEEIFLDSHKEKVEIIQKVLEKKGVVFIDEVDNLSETIRMKR